MEAIAACAAIVLIVWGIIYGAVNKARHERYYATLYTQYVALSDRVRHLEQRGAVRSHIERRKEELRIAAQQQEKPW